jgi:hypothetical protein
LTGRSNNKGTPPKRILKVLLVDLYVTWLDDPDLSIGIARSDGAWRPTSRYNATHIPKKLNDVVDHLVEHGFLLFIGGSNDRQYVASSVELVGTNYRINFADCLQIAKLQSSTSQNTKKQRQSFLTSLMLMQKGTSSELVVAEKRRRSFN